MAAFAYRAVDAGGVARRGIIEAGSAVGARRALRERALLPIAVEAARGGAGAAAAGRRGGRVGAGALAQATRQLATLIGADVRVEEALGVVSRAMATKPMGAALIEVRGAVLDGRSLATAMGEHPHAFPEFYRASIAAGEQSGRLADVLDHLAGFVERRAATRRKLLLALLYPALVAAVSLAMITLLLAYVVPDIVKVFVARGAELPFLTRALIALSTGVRDFGWAVAVAIGVAAVAGRRWLATLDNRVALDRWFARTAPFARFSQALSAARFAGSLATLVETGVPLVEALRAAAAVVPNRFIRAGVETVGARVAEGSSLAGAMAEADVFPPMLVAIVRGGEASGRLGPALARAGIELERELDGLASALVALVEPAVLLLMGGLVLLMVLAILTPIVGLNALAGR